MTDPALNWVVNQMQAYCAEHNTASVWCTDENALDLLPVSANTHNIQVISNRWDVAQQAIARGFTATFNDFELHNIADNSLDYFFYRISKEKPVVHFLINQAWRCLKPQGKFFISGHKNEGAKTYIDKSARIMGCANDIKKDGTSYSAVLKKCTTFNATEQLDDSDYPTLRPLPGNEKLFSKPGLFGWNKIDQGSAFLIDQLSAILLAGATCPTSCLDLGCGYGYLTMAAARLTACKTIQCWQMTDNNAAAVAAAAYNAQQQCIAARVTPADCANNIEEKFDLILCNPPFHQGFSVDGDLTGKFLSNAKRLLSPAGIAVFVVNQFIPLEKKAHGLFHKVTKVADNGSFKVVTLEL